MANYMSIGVSKTMEKERLQDDYRHIKVFLVYAMKHDLPMTPCMTGHRRAYNTGTKLFRQ